MKLAPAAVLAGALTLMSAGAAFAIVAPPPPFIAAAVVDAGRPAEDRSRDADRLPGEMLAFAEVKPGEKIAEILPGGGYFTRIFSKAVGPQGKVYAVVTPPQQGRPAFALPGYDNVTTTQTTGFATMKLPEPVDLVWTSQNYHDLAGNPANDMVAINKAVFDALKPGGLYVVLDHEARPGDTNAPRAFHRIDPATVVQQVTAAGFMSIGESDALDRPADPLNVASSRMHDQTSQFVYKFRKPL
jgi:predicted methyltransferase